MAVSSFKGAHLWLCNSTTESLKIRLPLPLTVPVTMAVAFLPRLLLLLWLVLAMLVPARAGEPLVVIVISERTASYTEAADALMVELERGGLQRADMALLTPAEFSAAGALSPKLFVAVGTNASGLLAATDTRVPLIAALLPPGSFEQIVQTSGRKPSTVFSGVFLSQPFSRQLDLIRLALPEARRIGVLWGADVRNHAPALQEAAQTRGLQVVSAGVGSGESAYPALQKILEDADLLLAVANPLLYNSSSIKNILLSSYRARVPFIGFSPAYVQAGAVFAVYSTPAMIGRQTAVMARAFLQGKPLPAMPQYPQEFNVSVNEQVARSLGLKLDAAALGERLRLMERGP